MTRSELDPDAIGTLAQVAQLNLPPERCEILAPALGAILAQFDVLYEVEIGETPPTNSFDPRWRTLK